MCIRDRMRHNGLGNPAYQSSARRRCQPMTLVIKQRQRLCPEDLTPTMYQFRWPLVWAFELFARYGVSRMSSQKHFFNHCVVIPGPGRPHKARSSIVWKLYRRSVYTCRHATGHRRRALAAMAAPVTIADPTQLTTPFSINISHA